MTVEARVNALCIKALLRVFRVAPAAPFTPGSWRLDQADVESVALWWALSQEVRALAQRVVHNPRQMTTVTEPVERVLFGEITGSVQASDSVRLQLVTGDPTVFVVAEPSETYLSGPNRVVAVTLWEAYHLLSSAAKDGGSQVERAVEERMATLDAALRVSAIKEVLSSPLGRNRLTPFERRQAAKMRSEIYRLAHVAASLLEDVRALESDALETLFGQALLPNLETWQRFELLCLLEAAFALGRATADPVLLDFAFTARRPAARVGPYDLYWQHGIPARPPEALDQGERLARDLAASLNVQPGTRRADVAVVAGGVLVALIECKWFQFVEGAGPAIADACDQLVAYSADQVHAAGGSAAELLGNSIVALAHRGPAPLAVQPAPVVCVALDDIEEAALDAWANHLTVPSTLAAAYN